MGLFWGTRNVPEVARNESHFDPFRRLIMGFTVLFCVFFGRAGGIFVSTTIPEARSGAGGAFFRFIMDSNSKQCRGRSTVVRNDVTHFVSRFPRPSSSRLRIREKKNERPASIS